MGGVISSIFGGGQSAPEPVAYEAEAAPREAEQEAEASNVRDEEKRKLRQRRQMGGTMLTSPLGVSDANCMPRTSPRRKKTSNRNTMKTS